MKRMTFKAEHEAPIKSGEKLFTSRWKDCGWRPGERRAAVAPKSGKPAFLTPASDAFATLECTTFSCKLWKDFTEEDAARCGVTREWYTKERTPGDFDFIYTYGFKQVRP